MSNSVVNIGQRDFMFVSANKDEYMISLAVPEAVVESVASSIVSEVGTIDALDGEVGEDDSPASFATDLTDFKWHESLINLNQVDEDAPFIDSTHDLSTPEVYQNPEDEMDLGYDEESDDN